MRRGGAATAPSRPSFSKDPLPRSTPTTSPMPVVLPFFPWSPETMSVYPWCLPVAAPQSQCTPHSTRVVVAVLGDLGRSPRMLYHAQALADSGADVDLVGYVETEIDRTIAA